MTVGVFTDHAAYRRVLGGFGASAERARSPVGSVVALPGVGDWLALVLEAARAGAVAAVVDDPAGVPVGGAGVPFGDALVSVGDPAGAPGSVLARLGESGMPVILDRPRLRFDLCAAAVEARAGVPARAIVVECAGGAAEREGLLRDSVGWARVIAGGELTLRSVSRSAAGLVGLLDGPGDLPVTVMFTPLESPSEAGLITVSALGETRSEVTLDFVAGVADIDTVTALGTHRAAPHPESPHRLALRRAVRATAGEPESDLRDLIHDNTLAEAISAYRPR